MRRRIVALSVAAAVLAITLFGVPLGYAVSQYFLGDERAELERVADVAAISVAFDLAAGQSRSEVATPQGDITVGFYRAGGRRAGGGGPRVVDGAPAAALRTGRVASEDDVDGQQVVAVPVVDDGRVSGVVRAASDYADVRWRIVGAWSAMLLFGVVAVVLTWLVARRQARRLALPLESMAATAQRLGEGDFAARTGRSGIPELDAAGAALDATAERLGALVDRERALSADASHQLRTPLTGLRLGLETALELPVQAHRAAITSALGSVDRLEQTVHDLLALARDSGPHGQPVQVGALLEELRGGWEPLLTQQGRDLRVHGEPDLPESCASAAAVRQVLGVLLDNATVHGAGTVTLTARDAGGALAFDVADEGAGPPDGAALFVRNADRDDGHGIGLALARTLAEGEGGRLRLGRPSPPVFSLLLPAGPPPGGGD